MAAKKRRSSGDGFFGRREQVARDVFMPEASFLPREISTVAYGVCQMPTMPAIS